VGLYVLVNPQGKRRPQIPHHLCHMVTCKPGRPDYCRWQLSGPQGTRKKPCSMQQRYCYPKQLDSSDNDIDEYVVKMGSTLWTINDEDGEELREFRVFHVYYSTHKRRAFTASRSTMVQAEGAKTYASPRNTFKLGVAKTYASPLPLGVAKQHTPPRKIVELEAAKVDLSPQKRAKKQRTMKVLAHKATRRGSPESVMTCPLGWELNRYDALDLPKSDVGSLTTVDLPPCYFVPPKSFALEDDGAFYERNESKEEADTMPDIPSPTPSLSYIAQNDSSVSFSVTNQFTATLESVSRILRGHIDAASASQRVTLFKELRTWANKLSEHPLPSQPVQKAPPFLPFPNAILSDTSPDDAEKNVSPSS